MAGPVVAAAVIFPPETFIKGVDDSKQLLPEQREHLAPEIRAKAIAIGVGVGEVAEIDRVNIYHARVAAIIRALEQLSCRPDHVLLDGRRIAEITLPHTAMVGGDRRSFCIAAASIIAKVTRDKIMCEYDDRFPGYGFARHKGYCTAEHFEAVERLGPSPIHRTSFAPVIAAAQLKLGF
jgi:ribonuclease HII